MERVDLTDEERIARSKRRFRESMIVSLLVGVSVVVLTVLYKSAEQRGIFEQFGVNTAQADKAFPWFLIGLLGVFAIFALIRYWVPKAERRPEFLRKNLDTIHAQWRWVTLILSGVAVLNTINFVTKVEDQDTASAGSVIFMLLTLALLVSFGPGCISKSYREALNDELMRTQRAKAARLGYLLAMLGAAVLYVVNLKRPELAGSATVVVLCAASAIPSLYFVLLEWVSGREN
jgi:predicted permease